MQVRVEQPEDVEAVRRINVAAFGQESEANLVAQLRGTDSTFSFVALDTFSLVQW